MQKNILILSSCIDDWGGSEELILKSTSVWNNLGLSIWYVKNSINFKHNKIIQLQNNAVKVLSLSPSLIDRFLFSLRLRVFHNVGFEMSVYTQNLEIVLQKHRPKLVVINQAINFDGLVHSLVCKKMDIPYVLVSQKAVDFFWPYKEIKSYVKEMYSNALCSYFVSEHNRILTEQQVGFKIDNCKVVNNPIKNLDRYIDYPAIDAGFNLLCLGRLFLLDKGQDRLIRIFSQDKWKNRSVKLSLVGEGEDVDALKDLIAFLGADNVSIIGWQEDVESLWQGYHALVAPSRGEGMTLSVLEAMAAGRTCIVTRVGGHGEIIKNGLNGFISDNSEEDFERVLEQAYQRRYEWMEIGLKARESIVQRYDCYPVEDFSNHICEYIPINSQI